MYKALHETYSTETKEQYLVQTQLQMKSSGIVLPEVHGTKKTLDTNVLTEEQKPQIQNKQVDENRPRLEQGRAGIKHKKPQPVADITASTSKSQKIPMVQNVTKNSIEFPVPEQLKQTRQKQLIEEQYRIKIGNYPPIKIQFIGFLQGHQKIYDQIVWKVRQTLDPK